MIVIFIRSGESGEFIFFSEGEIFVYLIKKIYKTSKTLSQEKILRGTSIATKNPTRANFAGASPKNINYD